MRENGGRPNERAAADRSQYIKLAASELERDGLAGIFDGLALLGIGAFLADAHAVLDRKSVV